jgi:hypothetical protein
MNREMEKELEAAVKSDQLLGNIVALLRRFKDQGVAQTEVYAFLERMRQSAPDEASDDRILEVADFVAGFCAPHMKIWEGECARPG